MQQPTEKSLKVYLYGYEFIVETDHHALHWLDRMKEKNGRLTRWSLALQTYSFTVQHKRGCDNANVDGLSHQPL